MCGQDTDGTPVSGRPGWSSEDSFNRTGVSGFRRSLFGSVPQSLTSTSLGRDGEKPKGGSPLKFATGRQTDRVPHPSSPVGEVYPGPEGDPGKVDGRGVRSEEVRLVGTS